MTAATPGFGRTNPAVGKLSDGQVATARYGEPAVGDITFTVYGKPATAGSKRAFPIKRKNGSIGAVVTEDNAKSKPWMAAVAAAAREVYRVGLMRGPVELFLLFCVPRNKGDFGTGRNAGSVKGSAPRYPIVKPDVLKMARAVEDALTGVVWHDDAQIVHEELRKEYGEPACCCVRIRPLE
jgi:Holliday junction resolvase RusA-like endonuclease